MAADTRFVLLLLLFLAVLVLCTKPLGSYIADIMEGRPNFALRIGGRFEAFVYRICGIEPGREMAWSEYAIALMLFNILGAVLVYGLMRLQGFLPFNPQGLPAAGADTSFNTAVSFITNTNWQSYSGESTLGYLAQMAGLAVQNFLSAATGIAVAIALIRGFARHGAKTIGNFWVDLTRCTLYLLLPLSLVLAIVLAGQGVVQNFAAYKDAATIETLTYQNPRTDAAGRPIVDAAGNPVTETATTRLCRWVRSPRRRRSNSSVPTAGDSSTRTPRIPMRTRRR
jgi:K+-transporting ATPase ATPase A chain